MTRHGEQPRGRTPSLTRHWTPVAALLLAAPGVASAQEPPRAVTLDEALRLAVEVHPNVVQAQTDVYVAGAQKREAIGNWLPSLNGNTSWSTNSATRFDPNTQRNVSAANTSASVGISASLELFDGFRRLAQNRSAAANLASADASLVNQEFQVKLQTKQAFFNALAADELVRVAETRIERAQEQLKIAREKLAAGSATRADTLSSRVELGNARLQRLNAETQRATAEANLARLIGLDGSVRATPDSSLFAPLSLDTAALRVEAVRTSPTVHETEAAAKAADASVAVSRAQFFPTISASYSNSYSGQTFDQLNNSWSARVQLSWPIFNGFTREMNYSRSLAQRDAAHARADDARRQANAQLTQHLATLAAAQTRLEIAEASRAASQEELRVQRERYRLGAATIVDVLAAQQNLDQAETDIVQARLDFLVAKAQIEALVGRELQ